VIATGEGYKTKASAIKGIESVQKNAPEAKIEDLSGVSSASGGGVLPMNGWPVVIGFVDGAVVGVLHGAQTEHGSTVADRARRRPDQPERLRFVAGFPVVSAEADGDWYIVRSSGGHS
jgi:hypothetical protein